MEESFIVFSNGHRVKTYQDQERSYDIKTLGGKIYKKVIDEPAFAIIQDTLPAEIEIQTSRVFQNVQIRPKSLEIKPDIEGGKIKFRIDKPVKLSIEFDNDLSRPLFIFFDQYEESAKEYTYFFESGKEYEIGNTELKSGKSVYISDGAIVYGSFYAENAENITIEGFGVLSGVKYHRGYPLNRLQILKFISCRNITIKNITVFDGPGWHVVPNNCENVTIDGIRIISLVPSGDGIDLVTCRNVIVKNCFFKTNDDCIAVKAFPPFSSNNIAPLPPVHNICVSDCTCWSATHGNALEIGYELRCDEVYDIQFQNCDIIHCEFEGYQSGGTLTIHNGDHADVHDIIYKNIRIEDSKEKIFDLKILNAVYSKDTKRGKIRNIKFENIHIVDGDFPPSIIKGFETEDSVFKVCYDENDTLYVLRDLNGEGSLSNIEIENFTVFGKRIKDFKEGKILIEIASDVQIK